MNRKKPNRKIKPNAKIKNILLLIMGVAFGIGIFLYVVDRDEKIEASTEPGVKHPEQITPSRPARVASPLEEDISPGPFQQAMEIRTGLSKTVVEIGKGDTLGHVLGKLGFTASEIHYVAENLSEVFDLTKVRPGAKISLFRDDRTGAPARLEYSRGLQPKLVLINTPGGWVASKQKYEPVRCVIGMEGSIQRTLWGSAVELYNLDPELVLNLADLFASEVDFFTDIQQGDKFRILYEKRYCQGRPLGSGRIFAAEFVNKGETFEAYYYKDSEGKGGYYDSKGHSKKKMFLATPLQYRRISSHFSKSRLHPILKIRRPHLGVDYSAAKGTPVETVATGTIEFVGWKGGYGNTILIKHNKQYTTLYAHLSKFADGLKKGQKVQQGDLIGYVGSTGLSTGPHLDFRLSKNGEYVDPLIELKKQSAEPINAAEKEKFLEIVKKRKTELTGAVVAKKDAAP